MKYLATIVLIFFIAGCTLVSITTQMTVGNDDTVEDATNNADGVELGGKPLISVDKTEQQPKGGTP